MEQIATRNDAICELIGFKHYLPKPEVRDFYEQQALPFILRWWHIPNVGRFNSFDLKFHCDYNWLQSAILEFKKYRGLDAQGSVLAHLFAKIERTPIFDYTLDLWVDLTEYAILLLQSKQKEQRT